jgi:Flp pilus assembly protein TadB
MRCFYHQSIEAVASCKNCGRGLCPGCAVDVGNGLACPNRCEAEVRALNRVIARNKTAYQKTSGAYARIAAFYAVVGGVFLAAGLANWRGYGWMLVPAGVIFLLAGLLHYVTGRRFDRE